VLSTRGADALRWYMFSSGSPWTTKRVSTEGIEDATRQFVLTLWNTVSFFVTYANLDGWEPAPPGTPRPAPEHVLDRWVRSRLHRTVREVTAALEDFDAYAGAQALATLVDDVSNWYVRRSRPRFWKASDPAAHATLHEVLVTVAQVLAPYTPFVSDELYRILVPGAESVHLTDWPEPDLAAIDDHLEAEMALAREVVTLGRAARNDARIGVRQPLPRAIALLSRAEGLRAEVVEEIATELNVKVLEIVESLEGLLDYRVVPNFRALAPRLRELMPTVKDALENVDGAEVRRAFDTEGVWRLQVAGTDVEIRPDDVEIRAEQHEELALAQDGSRAVALDLTLDDDLRAEGIAREFVRIVNDLRKAEGFAIADRVEGAVHATGRVHAAVTKHRDWIAGEVLARSFEVVEDHAPAGAATTTVDGEPVWISLRRA
jgi:isoleucyl-tRNA synthetase